MSRILVLGGGFSGVVAAERLAKELGARHQVLDMGFPVSRPELVIGPPDAFRNARLVL